MNAFRCKQFALSLVHLKEMQRTCHVARDTGQAGSRVPDELFDEARKELHDIVQLCKDSRFDAARASVTLGGMRLDDTKAKSHVDMSTLMTELKNAEDMIMHDMWARVFYMVAPDRTALINTDVPFGVEVHTKFHSTQADIRDAVNCLAADNNTAAVFHLMRVAEYGLRALAYDRRIRIPKNRPLELATWEDIIKQLEDAEKAIQGYPQTLTREAQYEFYHGAMMEFKRFKNKFRNRIMHTRNRYDPHEAMSAYDHVKAFMVILAGRIAEGKRTPTVWKGKRWITA